MSAGTSEFFDYKTGPVVGTNFIDVTKTGIPYYNEFLSTDTKTREYLRDNKNLVGEVVMMSAEDYYALCSQYGFPNSRPSVASLKAGRRRDERTLNHLKAVLLDYKRQFPIPVLNKADNAQEGLHRMMVIGDLLGWDHKVPVLVVDWADKQRAENDKAAARAQEIERKIQRAVRDALRYKFEDVEELEEQLQWELDDEFRFDDEIKLPVEFELSRDEATSEFIVTVAGVLYSFDYDDVRFTSASDNIDSSEIEDIDSEDIEDFLVRYFGDDWKDTHPHLKSTFNIK